MTVVITRAEAKALGLARYFTNTPCTHGHTAERYVSKYTCVECLREFGRARYLRARQGDEWSTAAGQRWIDTWLSTAPPAPSAPTPVPSDEWWHITKVIERFHLGQTRLYEAIERKQVVAKRVGRCTIISMRSVASYMETLPDAAPPPSWQRQQAAKRAAAEGVVP